MDQIENVPERYLCGIFFRIVGLLITNRSHEFTDFVVPAQTQPSSSVGPDIRKGRSDPIAAANPVDTLHVHWNNRIEYVALRIPS